jgi:hypothetical protein
MIQIPKERIQQFADEYGLSFNEASDQYHAVAKHLAANPIMPNRIQMQDVEAVAHHEPLYTTKWLSDILAEWQRRMFLAPDEPKFVPRCLHCYQPLPEKFPDPEIPEEIKDLFYDPKDGPTKTGRNDAIIEAYRRGKASR